MMRTFLSQILLALFLFKPSFMMVRGLTGHNFNNNKFNFIFVRNKSYFCVRTSVSFFSFLVNFVCFFSCFRELWFATCYLNELWTLFGEQQPLIIQYKAYIITFSHTGLDWCTNARAVRSELNLWVVCHIILFNSDSLKW